MAIKLPFEAPPEELLRLHCPARIEIVDTIGEWTLDIPFGLGRKQVYSQSFSSRSICVAEPIASMSQGAPRRSLQIDPANSKYFSEMTPSELTTAQGKRTEGIVRFVRLFLLPGLTADEAK